MSVRGLGAGKHDFPETLEECGINPRILHDGVRGIDDWVDRIVEFAESGDARRYTSNDVKGDAFEHLVQCVIEHLHHDDEVNCSEVEATGRGKTGVDLIGRTLDGKPHLHQCKFTKDPKHNLPYRGAVAEFVGACPRFDEGAGYGMTLWTTGNGISRNAQNAADPSLKVFGINWLGDTLGSDESFWDDIYAKSLGTTPKSRIGRIFKEHEDAVTPHDYQLDALASFKRKAEAEETFKGRFIYPTGAGKTLIESLILNHQIDRFDGGVHVVVAPRIALLIQLMRECRNYIGDKYVPIGLHSGTEEPESDDSDWMRRTQRNTTDVEVVKREISHARSKNRPAIVFSTYHSLHKLICGDLSFETMIADESQYCVSENYFEHIKKIDAKIKLYFTATERHRVGKDGFRMERSNDNEEVFGESLGEETITDLVKRGILVEPILHLMRGKPKEINRDTLIAEAQHIAEEQRRQVSDGLHAKTLFACRKAENIEIIVDSKNGNENLKKLKQEVHDHAIFTIISKKPFEAMIDGVPVSRKSFLERLSNHDGDALVFHYNILSEGIDVDGITGVAILRKMGDAKLLQTIGRCLRPFKKNRLLKKYAYVSVPVIDGDIRNSEHLREIVRKMLEGGLDINAEKVVVSDIEEKPSGRRGGDGVGGTRKPRKRGGENGQGQFDLGQTDLEAIKHELRKLIKTTDEEIAENYRLGMLDSKITNEVIDGILDGHYRSSKFDQSGYSSHADQEHLEIFDAVLESYQNRYYVVDKAWNRHRMLESEVDAKGNEGMRPITPLHMIKEHVDRLGDIAGKSALTFNIEYIPFLTEKGAKAVLATRTYCEATKNLAESQVIESPYLTVDALMKNATPPHHQSSTL